MSAGYYRYPTIWGNTVVFVSEDDLWCVPASGGVARRLTSNQGDVSYPALSPDGEQLAFVGREEGYPEVYLMPADGGSARRLTFLGSSCQVLGWTPDGQSIVFNSNYGRPSGHDSVLYTVEAACKNGAVRALPYGPARSIAYGPQGGIVLGRNTTDPARWKRYRGGTAGHFWIDLHGDGQFERLLPNFTGNITSPMWVTSPFSSPQEQGSGRIYFASDHEGVGNLYSCLPDGSGLRRHTDHSDFYVRNPSSDGQRIVYHAGGDLYVYEIANETSQRIGIDYRSPRTQRNRKFVDAGRFMENARLHPSGKALTLTTRGKLFTFYNHEGPVLQLGQRDGVRYRQPEWFNDGRRLLVVTDEPGEETLEIRTSNPDSPVWRLEDEDVGRVLTIKMSPTEDKAAITNHRHELLIVELVSQQAENSLNVATRITKVDRSPYRPIHGFDWSPDGRWLAYSFASTVQTYEIRLYHLEDDAKATGAAGEEAGVAGESAQAENAASGRAASYPNPITVTRPVLRDIRPAFDPNGQYLYFISYREFNPVHDTMQFDISFPWGMRPYLILLRADLPDPFTPHPELEEEESQETSLRPASPPAKPAEENNDENKDDENKDDDEKGDGKGEEDNNDKKDDDERDDDDGKKGDDDNDDDDKQDDDENGDSENNDRSAAHALGDIAIASSAHYRNQSGMGTDDRPAITGKSSNVRWGRWRRCFEAGEEPAQTQPLTTAAEPTMSSEQAKPAEQKSKQRQLRIDLDGITQRVLPFPVPDGIYGQIAGISGKAIFTSFEVHGHLDSGHDWDDDERFESGTLRAYNFKEYRSETLLDGVSSIDLSRNRKKMIYITGRRLRVVSAGEKAPSESGGSRRSGWIDLHRVKVSVDPQSEWEQMFREAWRLQRDHFWSEDMAQVDWHAVYERYFPLIRRVSTRGEFSDLMWEMQGELGTSHAYESGGDYRSRPYFSLGCLAADFTWEPVSGGYRLERFITGDPWDVDSNSPLALPTVDIKPGDVLLAINGQRLSENIGPAQLLVNQAGYEVLLTFAERAPVRAKAQDAPEASQTSSVEPAEAKNRTISRASASPANVETPKAVASRYFVVRTLYSGGLAYYRSWVNKNRQRVLNATQGKIGYVHIPDMGVWGYAEFHRSYLAAVDHDGLIIDVRYNAGGNVSQLILEKLARRHLGYVSSRWGGISPYPVESVAGPLVALTNEHAGSDGDIFCHAFRMMKLGPVIGKRTWGGVIGIVRDRYFVDGGHTTQPEFSIWFKDIGWNLENYGVEPDIDVDNIPQDYVNGQDAQLERAIEEALRLLAQSPVEKPVFEPRPSRAVPQLLRRNAT